MGLWSKKSISSLQAEASHEGEGSLRRSLGAVNLTFLGIGAIIGAGIFVLTGNAAATYAGPAVVLSMVLAGIACGFAGLCYAEFASMIPIAGSAYTYGYATLGEFFAWIIGWDLMLEYLFGAATVAVGWSGYFGAFMEQMGINLPAAYMNAPLAVDAANNFSRTGAVLNVPAMVLIGLMTVILVVGIRESANFNNVIVFLKVSIIFLVIGFGFVFVNSDNWHPFIPENTGTFGEFGISGILRGAGVIFFAYIGFDAVSTAAQEAKNPQKDMPIGILGSLAICTILYVLMALVMTGLAPYTELNVPDPVFVAVAKAGPGLNWLTYPITIAAIAGLASVVLVMLMAQPRIFYSMSRDGLLPPIFGKVHPKFKTPYITTILTGVVAAVVAGIFPIGLLGQLVSIGTLLAFVIVCAGVWILRVRSPEIPRAFRTPLVPLVPILGILSCFGLMAFLPLDTWLRLLIWLGLGVLIYFAYGRHHSHLGRAERGLPASGD
ncbi:MAG: amino acid permease [Gemmatimonadaceae bacterium]|nr:amino acid permease [Gemmatimonadaceae bacterium]